MRVVEWDSVPEVDWNHPRGGEMRTRRLMQGKEGAVDNFVLQIHHSIKDFYTPRHRHNFEQVRLHLKGTVAFPEGDFGPGIVVYLPVGTYYGPHTDDGAMFAVWQWGGDPSLVSHQELSRAREVLEKKGGTFSEGIYSWIENGKKHNKDGWVAQWEEHYQRPVRFPAPVYERPIFMNPDNYEWLPVEGAAGVSEKTLGEFNQRRTAIYFLRLEKTSRTLQGPLVGLVRKGRGRLGDQECFEDSAIELRMNETGVLRTDGELEVFIVRTGPVKVG